MPIAKLLPISLIIASKNSEARIAGTVMPWLEFVSEVIVVDQFSVDHTVARAKELGVKVIQNNPIGGNFDINRKFGMLKATQEWILYMDTDERPSKKLMDEMQDFILNKSKNFDGAKIPNEFYFLGKPLRYGLYNKNSSEIRLFRNGKWSYQCEEGYHRSVVVEGPIYCFQNSYRHFNVNSISEWFVKTNQYTELDSLKQIHLKPSLFFALLSAKHFFIKFYFIKQGFRDGVRGFLSVFYFMLYHFTLKAKIWEKHELSKLVEDEDYLKSIDSKSR